MPGFRTYMVAGNERVGTQLLRPRRRREPDRPAEPPEPRFLGAVQYSGAPVVHLIAATDDSRPWPMPAALCGAHVSKPRTLVAGGVAGIDLCSECKRRREIMVETRRVLKGMPDVPLVLVERLFSGEYCQCSGCRYSAGTHHPDDYFNANLRALGLLWKHLTAEQRVEFLNSNCFTVVAPKSKTRYTIDWQSSTNIYAPDKGRRYCIIPDPKKPAIPLADQLLAQKFLIEADEARFLKVAIQS